ncbi:immune inhibitor A domain-containing protein [Pseudoalteromonas sp. S16_S37]|uniref:immune inhibitor A domain-containing protein n=1 Tax=Pseudoalteromonas sp. S16_S37 TaxID=2720228 RepID=UPI001681AEB4|nr:immune inhibitor A domain-containing protein [Pseudoalteromonas sp. S16_S37]MBD1584645.1 M6 family metalloprotease domain-containing protein [Pseudoalteromonas sp. S16_S37]
MKKKALLAAVVSLACSGAHATSSNITIKPLLENNGGKAEIERNQILKTKWNVARGKASGSGFDNSKPFKATGRAWQGAVTTDRVLAILIDFPDYPVNAVTPDLTKNYYSDYSVEHYRDMLFSSTGYAGPSGQNLMSMKQYYLDQSGGSYQVEGKVFGWYTAANNAAYYGAPGQAGQVDSNAQALVMEAINQLANDPTVDLSYFDQEDRYDYDGDGDLREPDGILDHVMIYHSSIDQAAGGGALGTDAIWSHRSAVGFQPVGTTGYRIHDYTLQPVDGAAGVSAHEYGHDLGLPDEYDVNYTEDGLGDIDKAPGSLVGFWSVMSSGSYGGDIRGTAPTGMSPFAKQYLQSSMGGNWFVGTDIHENELTSAGSVYKLDAASVRGNNNDYIRIDLKDKTVKELLPSDNKGFISSPVTGSDLAIKTLDFEVDLSAKSEAVLTFVTDYKTDKNNSLIQVRVTDANGDLHVVNGNFTDMLSRFSQYIGPGFAGRSNGPRDAEFDLTYFAGQKVTVSLQYWTFNTGHIGVIFDDIKVMAESEVLVDYDADNKNNSGLAINGFEASTGEFDYPHYYLVEWRQHFGVDEALKNAARGASYSPGMLVWYVDTSYRPQLSGGTSSVQQGDNHVADHPGEGWLGLVDADRNPILYSTGEMAGSVMQIRDAAFSLDVQEPFDWKSIISGVTLSDPFINNNPRFIDWDDYSNYLRPATGRNIPKKGIIIDVLEQSEDKSVASIRISKVW